MRYNNTLKNFIVNFFLLFEQCTFHWEKEWISCALQILGKLLQFCRIKLNWVNKFVFLKKFKKLAWTLFLSTTIVEEKTKIGFNTFF